MPVLLECAIERANTDDGPLAVQALGSLVDAEPTALATLAARAVERKADLSRLLHEPSKAPSAAALLSVLARALPVARPVFVDVAGMLPVLGARLDAEGAARLAQDTALLVQDATLRELLSTPATTRWLSGNLVPPNGSGSLPAQVLPSLNVLSGLVSQPGGLVVPELGPPLARLLAALVPRMDDCAEVLAAAALVVGQIASASKEGAVGCGELGLGAVLLALLPQGYDGRQGAEPEERAAARVHAARALCSMALSDGRVREKVKEHLGEGGVAEMPGVDPVLSMHMQRLRSVVGVAQ